jgi:hypothetical protein
MSWPICLTRNCWLTSHPEIAFQSCRREGRRSKQAYSCSEEGEMDPALRTCAGDPRKLMYYR